MYDPVIERLHFWSVDKLVLSGLLGLPGIFAELFDFPSLRQVHMGRGVRGQAPPAMLNLLVFGIVAALTIGAVQRKLRGRILVGCAAETDRFCSIIHWGGWTVFR